MKIVGGKLAAICALVLLAGCESLDGYLLATSSTVIGLKIEQAPTTQTPTADLGYVRTELAVVPTDRGQCVKKGKTAVECPEGAYGSATSAPNVLMELRYSSILSAQSTIYQRLAIGDIAVAQPGAAILMAKDKKGDVDKDASKAIESAYAKKALSDIDYIVTCIAPKDGLIDSDPIAKGRLNKSVDEAKKNQGFPSGADTRLKNADTTQRLREVLVSFDSAIPILAGVIRSNESDLCKNS